MFAQAQGALRVVDMQTEHLDTALGIDARNPRFSWQVVAERPAVSIRQSRLIVGRDSVAVAQGQGAMCDLTSTSPLGLMTYKGKRLQPQTTYFWRVSLTDDQGKVTHSPVARFETGMLSSRNWRGCWISDGRDKDYVNAPYFRKAFRLGKDVRSARLYMAAAGLFELSVNGQRVGDHMLDPLYTRFDRRNLYVTHDVTPLLRQGENALGVVLGNGWYNHQAIGVWNFENAPWRNRPAFCLDLVVTYVDGSQEVVKSDLSWRTGHGILGKNNIYTGEFRDFTKVQKGWDMPGFDDSKWRGVGYRSVPSLNVTAQHARPIRIDWTREAKELRQINDTTWLYDFGQNMSGVTRLSLLGERGTVLHIRCGERLRDGQLDPTNIDVYYRGNKQTDPFQTDVVTLSGEKDEYTTQFNYKGFRYAQVETSKPMTLTAENLKACFMHSDVPQVGTIEASKGIIGRLMHASRYSYLSNLMGLPTDCPQREKNGWTGDGHLAIEAGLYNYDGITIYEKWMADHRDEQQPNGVLPDIIPTGGWGYGTDNGLDWTSTIAIIPWTLYLFYGDSQPLRDCYENIKRYVNYVDNNYPSHLTTYGRGDWVPVSVGSNKELTSSVYFYTDARILAAAAQMFGRQEDVQHYSQLAQAIRKAINDKYLDRERGIYAKGTQTELSVPLYWGIVPDECKALVAKNLNDKVIEAKHHLDVGVLGCKALLNALCQNGYTETAYRVAIQDTYPSWGWWVENGATTLLENWDLQATRDISDNHMMFGEIGAWFYKGLAGIYPDEQDPGFHHIKLTPYFPADLESFTATHKSPFGVISSGWKLKGRQVIYRAEIPANSYATLTLPDGSTQKLESGVHEIKYKLAKK